MSRVSTKSKTPFCGACQKAGKNPEEYNSHWTNTKGILTCPLILSSECGYCHEFGHWTKACPKLANRAGGSGGWSFSKKPADKYRVSDDSVKSSSSSKQKNLFSNLMEDSDTESESESDSDSESVNEPEPIRKLGYFDKPHGRLMDWTEFCSDSDSD